MSKQLTIEAVEKRTENCGRSRRCLERVVGWLALMAFADECNRKAGFNAMAIPERNRHGRMKWLRQYERQNGLCAICGEWQAPAAMTRDHIVPRAKGGGTDWNNIQLTCEGCNQTKGDAMPPNADIRRVQPDSAQPKP